LLGIFSHPYLRIMKMTFELPPDLVLRLKLRAAQDGSKLKDLIAEACRRLLAEEEPPKKRRSGRSPFPVVKGGMGSGEVFSPGHVDELLWGGAQ
jgi:hypothetical protein